MTEGASESGIPPKADGDSGISAAPASVKRPRRRRTGLIALLSFLFVIFAGLGGAIYVTGGKLRLPIWMVAEAEARLNAGLSQTQPGIALAIGGVQIGFDKDGIPQLAIEDARLLHRHGAPLLVLPEARIRLDGAALLQGELRPLRLTVIGANLSLTRRADGSLDLSLGGDTTPEFAGLAEVFAGLDTLLSDPALASLRGIEADALTLTFTDLPSGHVWNLGDGRLRIDNRADELRAEIGVTLLGQDGNPAQAQVTAIARKGAAEARLSATVDRVPSGDLAALLPPLAPLAVIDAAISGSLAATLTAPGITALEAKLDIGAGALRPTEASVPIAFDRAGMQIAYDPARGRVNLTRFDVESTTLRLAATGHSYLTDAAGTILTGPLGTRLPDSFLTQIHIDGMQVDPAGLFKQPVRFTEGAIDLRLSLNPFRIDIGQVALVEADRRLSARGMIGADAGGWTAAVDLALDRIGHADLLALWPVNLVVNTRNWLEQNVLEGTLTDVKGALRIAPGKEPILSMGYDFRAADVRFIRTLPPIRDADGYATIEGQTYTMVVSRGSVTPPLGGVIDMAGSVFSVLDITKRPAQAEVILRTSSTLTAALSLLDEPPFGFLTKAGRPVDLGQGQAMLDATLRFPLLPKIQAGDVSFRVNGEVRDFASDKLIADKTVTAPFLSLSADPRGLRVSGPGQVGKVPFDVTFLQPFGADGPPASIEGTVELSRATIEEFNLGLPEALASGTGQAMVTISLPKGEAPRLTLVSDLSRLTLSLPGTGWRKSPAQTGRLDLQATLSRPARVDRLSITAPGLVAEGSITLTAQGGLSAARFDRVQLDDWLDGVVEVAGRGAGRSVAVTVLDGRADLRRKPEDTGAGGGATPDLPLVFNLQRLQVTDSIALTRFRGEFTSRGGFSGRFSALVNDGAAVTGTVVPSANGSAFRIRSENAGGVLASAGVFASARGGQLDLMLRPRGTDGRYDGRAEIGGIRVVDAPILAELLNAVSVVGIIEQLNGDGLLFSEAQADFLLTPAAVEIRRGSAVGASLGVTMAGVYGTANRELALQGVVSPIYMLNGIGSVLTRRGEGLFGFNYELRGTADRAQVSVNPLSILTPGMFRELFRGDPPRLGNPDG